MIGGITLNNTKRDNRDFEGKLPETAPLANPYVPFQQDNPSKYEPEKALIRGTLFPGLDLPFMGMVNKNEKPKTPLAELQTVAFVLQELALYLDTHRDDAEALETYRNFQKMYQAGREKYEKAFGPLNHFSVGSGEYNWLNDPWPWEYAMNREV